MEYKVTCKSYVTNTEFLLGTYESEIEALEHIEACIDDDIANGDYESYDYLMNGELIS